MISRPPTYGAFNARWLKAKDVARTFVPVPQFQQLTQSNNSLLLGPRGCGKTTLLKMLTRPALSQWMKSERNQKFKNAFSQPLFEAIYIPSDVRWCYELASLGNDLAIDATLRAKTQRLMVSTNTVVNILTTAENLLEENSLAEPIIANCLIKQWSLGNTLSSFSDIRTSLLSMASSVRGYLAVSDLTELEIFLKNIHPSFFSHALDVPVNTINVLNENIPETKLPVDWALCFDELEIAPEWLRIELLESLRSSNQNVFLKLTWTPLLPSGLRTSPESSSDFKAIRLWHSHLTDPKVFCENLTQEFLHDRLLADIPAPISIFSRSILASDGEDDAVDAYDRGSTEYDVFKELASKDRSFRRLLERRGVSPDDPQPRNTEEKDQLFRKLKPVALLRKEFLNEQAKWRSRKAVTIYAGREAIYAMTEGNPRWLLGILNDLVDHAKSSSFAAGETKVTYADQARILNNAARRLLAHVKASPFRLQLCTRGKRDLTLLGFVNRLGDFFRNQILSSDFPLDPVGSFFVPDDVDMDLLPLIEQLLELGAIVYVGNSPQDVPVKIQGSRFRLTYMLAPIYRLPLRLYREISLNDVLSGKGDEDQPELFA